MLVCSDKMLKFYIKVFLCDRQGHVSQANLYMNRACWNGYIEETSIKKITKAGKLFPFVKMAEKIGL